MPSNGTIRLAIFGGTISVVLYSFLAYHFSLPPVLIAFGHSLAASAMGMSSISAAWYPPSASWITDLSSVINGSGVHGFIFNSSNLPNGVSYGTYNWCNMPHVRKQEYPVANNSYQLQYVEVIHRHHKRTPYAANTFPRESYGWDCSDEGLFYYGQPLNPIDHNSTTAYWQVYTSESNPFAPTGFNGSCQFPQISRGGLDDSWQHGKDLFEIYHDLLKFLPDTIDESVSFRVTNNVITSQVAGMVANAMYGPKGPFPLRIQPASIDSLEPAYTCSAATAMGTSYAVSSNNTNWTTHLNASTPLFQALDAISNVPPKDDGFHRSWDHYFDNLSARQCHNKPLPCNISNPTLCVTQAQAEEVYRLGQYEYSYIYRGAAQSLDYSTASYGIWAAELASNIRAATAGSSKTKYRHNVAHDGSISRLLSILQIDQMVWPGMGSEIVFEVYKSIGNKYALRVLWGGQVLRSSHPSFALMDMIDVDMFLGYIDKLVGAKGAKIPTLCAT